MNEKSKTREKIAGEYGICVKTLNKWLKNAKIEITRGMICPNDQKKIYEAFGFPKKS